MTEQETDNIIERHLDRARELDLETMMLAAVTKDGQLVILSSTSDVRDIIFLSEMAKDSALSTFRQVPAASLEEEATPDNEPKVLN